jgi:hypothetical protein
MPTKTPDCGWGEPRPIDSLLPELRRCLAGGPAAVLLAAPGAGKTTRVPLALLHEPWLAGQRIVHARAAASGGQQRGSLHGSLPARRRSVPPSAIPSASSGAFRPRRASRC